MASPNINLEEIQPIRQSHSGRALDYKIENQDALTSEKFLKKSKKKVTQILKKDKHIPSKNNFKLHCMMELINPETDERKEEEVFFSTPALVIQSEEDISEVYDEASEILKEKLFKFMSEGSGWHLKSIPGIHLHISLYDPINGSCYTKLPSFYKSKKYLINIQNDDNLCGKWAITISLNPPPSSTHNKGRITKQTEKDSKKYNWSGINFPMKTPDLLKFEKNNPTIGIKAFCAEKKDIENIHPLYLTKKNLPDKNIAKVFLFLDL